MPGVFQNCYQNREAKITKSFCSGIINLLFDGFTYNTRGHFAHCSYFSSPLWGSEKYYATRKISTRIICKTREDKGKRGNPPYRPCPHHNPSEVIFRRYRFLADNVTSRVTCLSPFSILQRLITIIHFHKRIQIASRVTSNESLRNTHNLKANRM